ncbi:MAG: glutamate--cysteine ligase [Bdellovibrionales bacterium]|nr:glutamate--cysteine ligase [Bdellovibrionales bacterium]
MSQDNFRAFIHQKILDHSKDLQDWFLEKSKGQVFPFYSSFDIRDSGYKIACVDANLFPAGFNNICEEDQRQASLFIKEFFKKYNLSVKTVLLLTEEHTKNLYYWDNVYVIRSLIEKAGFQVIVCVPGKTILSPQRILTATGQEIEVEILKNVKGDIIISNNDFSVHYNLPQELTCFPPFSMGWLFRKKHHFFQAYNLLIKEFAEILKIDSWYLQIETRLFSPFDVESPLSQKKLKDSSNEMIDFLKKQYQGFFIQEIPYLFIKNNSGTYGLGVIPIQNLDDLNHWTYKLRKKMKATKGDVKKDEIIIQEGIPTSLHDRDHQSTEPVVYMIGTQVVGGFLRSHKKEGSKTNLNSPGAVYKRFCMSDLEITVKGMVMENVYSWLAKIGSLALVEEMKKYNSNK